MSQIDDHISCGRRSLPLTLNPDAAIYKLWRAYRDDEQFLGAPITAEIAVSDGVVQQAFASGAVIEWSAENGARLVSS